VIALGKQSRQSLTVRPDPLPRIRLHYLRHTWVSLAYGLASIRRRWSTAFATPRPTSTATSSRACRRRRPRTCPLRSSEASATEAAIASLPGGGCHRKCPEPWSESRSGHSSHSLQRVGTTSFCNRAFSKSPFPLLGRYPLCPDWVSRSVRHYIAKAGIQKRGSCRLLRHTVATLMLEGGADIRYVAEMLGHTRLENTQHYTRVSIDRLRTVHASAHPAAGLGVAMATELCAVLPQGGLGVGMGGT
jgi:integrase